MAENNRLKEVEDLKFRPQSSKIYFPLPLELSGHGAIKVRRANFLSQSPFCIIYSFCRSEIWDQMLARIILIVPGPEL